MKTYHVFLRNGEKVRIKADGYNLEKGIFYINTKAKKGQRNKTGTIAEFKTEEVLGVVKDEHITDGKTE